MASRESFDIDGLMVFKNDLTSKDQSGRLVAGVKTPDRYKPSSKEPLSSAQIGKYVNTTAYWNEHATIIPKKGDIYIYSDGSSFEEDGQTILVPLIKIGTGDEYLGLLPFVGEDESRRLSNHINDNVRHITAEERASWNNKVTVPRAEMIGTRVTFTQD